jgi:hypothetical protein
LLIAPRLTRPYRDELQTLGVTPQRVEAGIWRLQGGLVVHPTWVLETEELAGLDHPLLTLVSPKFLAEGVPTYELMRQGGYTELVVYLAQQIHQFRLRGKEFAMQHLGTEDQMEQLLRDFVATLSPEDRLRGLPPEDRLRGLPAEELVRGLSPQELERLRQLLQSQSKADNPSRPE